MSFRADLKLVALGALALAFAPAAVAQAADFSSPVTFAQFRQSTGGNNFIYTAAAPNPATLASIAGGVPVSFEFQNIPGLPADLQGPQDAHLFLLSTAAAPAQANTDGIDMQAFEDGTFLRSVPPYALQIIRDTPAAEGDGARTNLLSVSFEGNLLGFDASHTASLIANARGTDGALYESEFLSFPSTTTPVGNMNVAFTSLLPSLQMGSNQTFANFNSFTAAGAGSFDTTTPDGAPPVAVPEPASAGLLLLAGATLARRRKSSR